ncbi:MAG: EF-P beta-lysylation protein EpmB [Gammaproteobacteria bacterium]|nr:EF-P beta-lysylation protein EpmB [Gammaproteobacteria bacterium]
MIAQTSPTIQPEAWQRDLREAYLRPADLLADLGLPAENCVAVPRFPFRVPRPYAARMRPGDPGDPLLLQVLPRAAEHDVHPGFVADPVGDLAAEKAPGLLHKYPGRALLLLTGACAVHCRYCFRQHFPYAGKLGDDKLAAAFATLAADASISEIILSGGDPLTLKDDALARVVARLARIPHVRRLRIHTRLPVVIPNRVTDGLLAVLTRTRLKPVVVLHVNHAREIDAALVAAAHRLTTAHVPVFNQSVLLAGINDDVATLAGLSEALFDAGITPYYLHFLDRVAGAAHFDVPATHARALAAALRARLPGYLVPRLVEEVAGAPAKMPLV